MWPNKILNRSIKVEEIVLIVRNSTLSCFFNNLNKESSIVVPSKTLILL